MPITHAGPPARLLFVGDIHGDVSGIAEAVTDSGARHVLLLGDLELERSELRMLQRTCSMHGAMLWWIYGNHDWERPRSPFCLHGKIVDMAGLRVAGISMPHASKTGNWRTPRVLKAFEGHRADILVSHDAPYPTSIPRWVEYDAAMRAQKGRYWKRGRRYVPTHWPRRGWITPDRAANRRMDRRRSTYRDTCDFLTAAMRLTGASLLVHSHYFDEGQPTLLQWHETGYPVLYVPHDTGIVDEQLRCWQRKIVFKTGIQGGVFSEGSLVGSPCEIRTWVDFTRQATFRSLADAAFRA